MGKVAQKSRTKATVGPERFTRRRLHVHPDAADLRGDEAAARRTGIYILLFLSVCLFTHEGEWLFLTETKYLTVCSR